MKLRELIQTEQVATIGRLVGGKLLPHLAPVEKKVAQDAVKNVKTAAKALSIDAKKDDEEPKGDAAIIFGRFNPPHKGHKEAWQTASNFQHWYVGTNKSTQGPKDPLPFDVKIQAMLTIWPKIQGHILAEQTWWSLAAKVYEKHGSVKLHVVTDENDAKIFVPGLQKQNGVKGPHGFYDFKEIVWEPAPRLSSATDLRDAVRRNDRAAFSKAAGVSANTPVAGEPFFDLVAEYLNQYPVKENTTNLKDVNRVVREMRIAEAKPTEDLVPDSFKDSHQGNTIFRDVGGYDRTYHLNRVMMAAAMADGKSKKPLPMDPHSFVEKYNVVFPYTDLEHAMMMQAFATVPTDKKELSKRGKSEEAQDTNIQSIVAKPKRNKYGI